MQKKTKTNHLVLSVIVMIILYPGFFCVKLFWESQNKIAAWGLGIGILAVILTLIWYFEYHLKDKRLKNILDEMYENGWSDLHQDYVEDILGYVRNLPYEFTKLYKVKSFLIKNYCDYEIMFIKHETTEPLVEYMVILFMDTDFQRQFFFKQIKDDASRMEERYEYKALDYINKYPAQFTSVFKTELDHLNHVDICMNKSGLTFKFYETRLTLLVIEQVEKIGRKIVDNKIRL